MIYTGIELCPTIGNAMGILNVRRCKYIIIIIIKKYMMIEANIKKKIVILAWTTRISNEHFNPWVNY